jgi:DNA-binding CsgD family transcriptional regulator
VLANDSNLSIHNPIFVYSLLAAYGVVTVFILTYVHAKFRIASKTLKLLADEWQSAQSRHAGFVGLAQEQLSKLSPPPPGLHVRSAGVNLDLRNQVVLMARRGITPSEIARSCGLHEGEVEVLLGMVRIQR